MSTQNAQHTPGPWKVQILETEHHEYPNWTIYCVRSPQNVCLATLGEMDRYYEADHGANARAMAAVPDLIAALEYVESCAPPEPDGYLEGDDDEIVEVALTAKGLRDLRAALAKAKGID